jgi:hypothetical protein
MLTEAQIKERATYIGSSDASIIVKANYDEWETLVLRKTGQETWNPNKQTQLLMDAGSHLEPFIIDQWAKQNDRQVNFRGGGKTILIDGIPMHSTFDGRVVGDNAPLEIKAHFGFKDMEELCDFYAPQCQHHMLVSGSDRCYLVALFGVRCRLEWRMLKKDESWCMDYIANCKSFWSYYQGWTPHDPIAMPPVDHSDMFTMNMKDLDGWSEEDDHLFGFQAQHIIDAKQAVAVSDQAKDMFKKKVPNKCRRMDYDLQGNLKGHKIRITRSRAGTVTCTHIKPKENGDD